MFKCKSALVLMIVSMLIAGNTRGTELGVPAPELEIGKWVKGAPITLQKEVGKTIFVIEFWATWCDPCKSTMPHLTKLQAKYRDQGVVFIGISDEDLGTVQKFLDHEDTEIGYSIAIDNQDKTTSAYLRAFGIKASHTRLL